MINCQIFGLCRYLGLIQQERAIANAARFTEKNDIIAANLGVPVAPQFPQQETLERLKGIIAYGKRVCDLFFFEAPRNRLERFERRIRDGIDREGVSAELRALEEAIDDEINFRYFYHYPPDKARVLLKFQGDWQNTLISFPSAKPEIEDAVDW
jgi:hypothetical protein